MLKKSTSPCTEYGTPFPVLMVSRSDTSIFCWAPPVRMLYCLERRTANASNTLGWISSLNLKSLNEKQALLYSNYENPYLRVIVKCIRDHTHICLNVFAFKTEN